MDSGRCRRCGRPFTAGEITGIGILRTRPEHRGGPIVEFPCPGCRTVMQLVPFGNGRYALPGQPPPPPPTDAERAVPWQRPPGVVPDAGPPPKNGAATGPSASVRSAPPPETPAAPPPAPPTGPRDAPPPPSRPAATPPPASTATAGGGPSAEPPLTPMRAYDALGLAPTATTTDVERAFRERALLCHPDKVAHLDPEFVALAERKFRRLTQARDLLLGVGDRSDGARRG